MVRIRYSTKAPTVRPRGVLAFRHMLGQGTPARTPLGRGMPVNIRFPAPFAWITPPEVVTPENDEGEMSSDMSGISPLSSYNPTSDSEGEESEQKNDKAVKNIVSQIIDQIIDTVVENLSNVEVREQIEIAAGRAEATPTSSPQQPVREPNPDNNEFSDDDQFTVGIDKNKREGGHGKGTKFLRVASKERKTAVPSSDDSSDEDDPLEKYLVEGKEKTVNEIPKTPHTSPEKSQKEFNIKESVYLKEVKEEMARTKQTARRTPTLSFDQHGYPRNRYGSGTRQWKDAFKRLTNSAKQDGAHAQMCRQRCTELGFNWRTGQPLVGGGGQPAGGRPRTGGIKRPHRYRPGTVALREIRRYQRSH